MFDRDIKDVLTEEVENLRLMGCLNSGLCSKITVDTGARQLDNEIKIPIILEIC
jgi:hypothetical protein